MFVKYCFSISAIRLRVNYMNDEKKRINIMIDNNKIKIHFNFIRLITTTIYDSILFYRISD